MKTVLPFIVALAAVPAGIMVLSPAIEKATAKKAKAVIDAPTWVAAGPVLLKGSKSIGSSWQWRSSGPSIPVGDNGEDLVVASCAPGVYSAELTVKSGGAKYSESVAVHTFQVGGSPPTPGPVPPQPQPGPTPVPPGPQPGPNPGPTPGPSPDNKFGLAKITFDLVSKINAPNKAAVCRTMSTGLKQIAAKIDAGGYKGPLDVVQDSLKVFASLGADHATWDATIQDIRKAITKAVTMTPSMADLSQALKEVAAGLDYVQ